jgi:Flp pilus assembly protein TadD
VAGAVQPATADYIAGTIARSWDECLRGAADEAVVTCTRLLAPDPGRSAVTYHYAATPIWRRANDRAISNYDQMIQLDPKNAAAYNGRGVAYQSKDDCDRAISDCDQVIQLTPKILSPASTAAGRHGEKSELR